MATQAARQASESWKPVDRARQCTRVEGGWAGHVASGGEGGSVRRRRVVVEGDDDAGVAWTPYAQTIDRAGYDACRWQ